MKTGSAIERYNRLFLKDLGSAPRYEWKWSEDLIHVMDAVDGAGKPILSAVARQLTGTNELMMGSPIIYLVQQEKRIRRFPGIWQQWVVCALIELNADDGAVHGTGMAAWIPVYDKRSRPACVPEGIHPNQEHTEAFIQQVRKTRVRDAEEMGKFEDFHRPATVPLDENEYNTELVSRADKKKFDEYKLRFKDKFTAFGEEPGKKGGTSFPTPESQLVH